MGAEDLELIKSAISNARNLLYDEVESVCVDELSYEYKLVIKDLDDALKIIENEMESSCVTVGKTLLDKARVTRDEVSG